MTGPRGRTSPRYWIFVDASGFIATAIENDDRHRDAVAILTRLQEESWHLCTTTVMLAEAHALIVRELGSVRGATFLSTVYASPGVTVELVTRADEQRAMEILRQYADKAFSFADALAFAVCERLGISYAFSFDRHFRQYGRLHIAGGAESW